MKFGSKRKNEKLQREFAREWAKKQTGFDLLKASVAGDTDQLRAMLMPSPHHGRTYDTELWFAVETFLMVAHRIPAVIEHLKEHRRFAPDTARQAFTSAIDSAQRGTPQAFMGGNSTGQAMLVVSLVSAIAVDEAALKLACELLGDTATQRPLGCTCNGRAEQCPGSTA